MMEWGSKVPGEYMYEDMVMGSMHPRHIIDKIPDLDMTGDILLASYPKTGTTWMQELLWLVCHDGDTEGARSKPLVDRFPHIEFSLSEDGPHDYDKLLQQPSPRLIKTHLPVRFFTKQLQKDIKVVVTVRNPKDTLVSFYHFYRMNALLGNFTGNWDDFFEMYKAKHMNFGDYFDWYTGWWQLKDKPNVLFVKYEDMKQDLNKIIKQVANFVGKPLPEKTLDDISSHLQFSSMKDNKTTNFAASTILKQSVSPFMRKGVIGDWKNYFNKDQSDYVDEQYEQTLLKQGLTLQFQ